MDTKSNPLCSKCKHPVKFCICPDVDLSALKNGDTGQKWLDSYNKRQEEGFKNINKPFTI